MQSIITHHIFWTVFAATGVIFGASYLLWMIQRVFYGKLGVRPDEVPGWDLTAREHLELWPFAALFLAMGLASPFWMRAIDTYGAVTAGGPAASSSVTTQNPSSRPERAARSGEIPVLALSAQPRPLSKEAH
jgi:NADH-quinone oxidoreductase subunit M